MLFRSVVPGNVGDIGGMIASAMAVYGKVGAAQAKTMSSMEKKEQKQLEMPEQKETANEEMKRSMLEGFENATQRK